MSLRVIFDRLTVALRCPAIRSTADNETAGDYEQTPQRGGGGSDAMIGLWRESQDDHSRCRAYSADGGEPQISVGKVCHTFGTWG